MAASQGNMQSHFLSSTAQDSTSEIAASQIAVNKASDPRVKQFAQQMIQDHQQLNQQLTSVAQQKGVDVPQKPDEMHVKAAAYLNQLSGRDFDREYMSMMVA